MFKKILSLSLLALFLSLTLSACSFTFPWEKERSPLTIEIGEEGSVGDLKISSSSGDLRKFTNEESLKVFLASASTGGGLTASWLLAEDGYGLIDESNLNAVTNNQSQVFSSADIIKFDSGYVYALVKNDLLIINTLPASEAKIVSKISFPSRPLELVVSAGRLAVLGNDNQIKNSNLYRSFKRKSEYTFLKVFDILDPANPREIRSLFFEGGYSGLRLSGNYAYLLTASPAYYSDGEPLTPRIIENNKLISGACSLGKDCISPAVFYFDHPYLNYNFLSLSAVSLADKNEPINNQLFLVDSSYSLNISGTGNFYLSRFSSLSTYDLELEIKREKIFSKLTNSDQEIIKKIESSPEYILSAGEKRVKTAALLSRYLNTLTELERQSFQAEVDSALVNKIKQRINDLEKTDIYKFALRAGKIEYQARGQVLGQVLNRLALDEQGGHLRLVTVRNNLWSLLFEDNNKFYSNVYILDSSLRSVGTLKNIVTEQSLYAARFLGERIYISTTDHSAPVYVVDLSEISKPSILGAIRIANLSNFYSFNQTGQKILGLGREAAESPSDSNQGLKLSLFDFSDLQKPKELSGYLIGDLTSDSIALKDYRSLAYTPGQKTLVLPVVLQENNLLNFSGVFVFSTENEILNLKGRVDHLFSSNFSPSDYWRSFNYYDNTVKRSLIEGDSLYTFSNKYLRINNLSDLAEIKTISLAPVAERIFIPSPSANSSEAPSVPAGNNNNQTNENNDGNSQINGLDPAANSENIESPADSPLIDGSSPMGE